MNMPLELKRDDLFDLPDPNSEDYRVPTVTITADGLVFCDLDGAMVEVEEEFEDAGLELEEETADEIDDDGEA